MIGFISPLNSGQPLLSARGAVCENEPSRKIFFGLLRDKSGCTLEVLARLVVVFFGLIPWTVSLVEL